jgi:hypothetical protein
MAAKNIEIAHLSDGDEDQNSSQRYGGYICSFEHPDLKSLHSIGAAFSASTRHLHFKIWEI